MKRLTELKVREGRVSFPQLDQQEKHSLKIHRRQLEKFRTVLWN
jgi:hypothetical protein